MGLSINCGVSSGFVLLFVVYCELYVYDDMICYLCFVVCVDSTIYHCMLFLLLLYKYSRVWKKHIKHEPLKADCKALDPQTNIIDRLILTGTTQGRQIKEHPRGPPGQYPYGDLTTFSPTISSENKIIDCLNNRLPEG